jgi:hypothetical protein
MVDCQYEPPFARHNHQRRRSFGEFASGARLVPLMNPERAVTLAELEL